MSALSGSSFKNVLGAQQRADALKKKVAVLDEQITTTARHLWDAYSYIKQRVSERRLVSVNRRTVDVQAVLEADEIRNFYQDLKSGKGALANDPYLQQQINVRQLVSGVLGYREIEEDLIYGSLNTGNGGCSLFGPFCFVLEADYIKPKVSFTKLNSYCIVNANLLQRNPQPASVDVFDPLTDFATWTNVVELAALKFGPQLLDGIISPAQVLSSPQFVDNLIANYSDSIEAQLPGPIPLDRVIEVRVSHVLILRRLYIQDKIARGLTLHDVEQLWIKEHEKAFSGLEIRGLHIVPTE